MDAPSRRWAAWLTATLLSFAVLEAQALREPLTEDKPSGTLSAALRRWLGIAPAGKRRWIASGLFAAFWLWFVGHVAFAWPPNDIPRRQGER